MPIPLLALVRWTEKKRAETEISTATPKATAVTASWILTRSAISVTKTAMSAPARPIARRRCVATAFVGPGESCDDGNAVDGDGCGNDCALESCGNGVVDVGEDCDDGNASNSDECLNTCVMPFCGDGYLHVGEEECEDDKFSNFDDCTNECLVATCGDGYTWANVEQCDDGNTSNSDECLNSCEEAACGDGHIRVGLEECDDGNIVDDDGCDVNCAVETKYVFASGAQFTGNLGVSRAPIKSAKLSPTRQISPAPITRGFRAVRVPQPFVSRNRPHHTS